MADSLRNLFWTTRGFFLELAPGVGDMNNFKVNSFTMDLLFSLLLMSDFAVATSVQLVLLQYHFLPSVFVTRFLMRLLQGAFSLPCLLQTEQDFQPTPFLSHSLLQGLQVVIYSNYLCRLHRFLATHSKIVSLQYLTMPKIDKSLE